MNGVVPPQVQDCTSLVEPREILIVPFLQPVEVALDGSMTLVYQQKFANLLRMYSVKQEFNILNNSFSPYSNKCDIFSPFGCKRWHIWFHLYIKKKRRVGVGRENA